MRSLLKLFALAAALGTGVSLGAWVAIVLADDNQFVYYTKNANPTGGCNNAGHLWINFATGARFYCDGAAWQTMASPAGDPLPTGAIVFIISGACPTGYTEESALSGKTLIGTTNGAGDVGTTGGADSITPSAHAGAAVADHASHTHTYTEVPNHVHPYCSQTATTGGASSYEHGTIDTSSAATECSMLTNNPSGGVATGTTAGPGAALTHSVTQPSAHSAMDNRSAFVRLIACKKD